MFAFRLGLQVRFSDLGQATPGAASVAVAGVGGETVTVAFFVSSGRGRVEHAVCHFGATAGTMIASYTAAAGPGCKWN